MNRLPPLVIAALLAIPLAVSSLPAHAQQMYKCTVDGRTTFAEFPCGKSAEKITVRPVAGDYAPAPLAVAAPAGRAAAPTSDRHAQLDEMVRQRRIRELEYEIRDAENDMDAELGALKGKKRYAGYGLAGATWEASISQEMQAVTAKWRGKIDALNGQLATLRKP